MGDEIQKEGLDTWEHIKSLLRDMLSLGHEDSSRELFIHTWNSGRGHCWECRCGGGHGKGCWGRKGNVLGELTE